MTSPTPSRSPWCRRLSDGAALLWAYVTYVAFSLAHSFVNIPYGSLASGLTQDSDVRAKMSTARMLPSNQPPRHPAGRR